MKNKTIGITSTILAIATVLGTAAGSGIHKRWKKFSNHRLSYAARCFNEIDEIENSLDFSELSSVSAASDKENISLFKNAKSAYVMETFSRVAMFEKNTLKRLPIASMCKIMTLLLSFEAIDNEVISLDEEIMVSENAAAMGGSQVFLEANATYPVRELLKSIVVCSANDSCVAMAEKIAGSDELFVAKMNERAKELGCENTLFANCTGLPKEPQYSCAKDVALMLLELIKHEEYFTFGKIWMDTFQHPEGRTTEISNTNRLIKFYKGCDGGKTGFTSEAGFCLAATAKRNDMRVISVVIGESDSKTRFKEVAESFDYAFANYSMKKVIDASQELSSSMDVSGGKKKTVAIKPARDGYLLSKVGEKLQYETEIVLDKKLKAPIAIGVEVGKIFVYCNGVEKDCIPVVTTQEIDKAGYLDVLRDVANDWNLNG